MVGCWEISQVRERRQERVSHSRQVIDEGVEVPVRLKMVGVHESEVKLGSELNA